MRYKNNVLDKLTQADTLVNKLAVQVNRNFPQNEILETLTLLKEQIEKTRETISIEHDDFEKQFAPK
jgi:hypothetical protein